jgi:hypothetical protein
MPSKKTNWSQVKAILTQQNANELIKLTGDLYRLSKENRAFIESRFLSSSETLGHYKEIIATAVYPDIDRNKPIQLAKGRKAISDYRKATNDALGTLELMVHYLEQGNDFTADYGDIDAAFYRSLCSMLDGILDALAKQASDIQDRYVPRLEQVVTRSSNIGWGYHDYLSEQLDQFMLDFDDD